MARLDVSAVVLSSREVTLALPGVTVVPYVSTFRGIEAFYDARIRALCKVRTRWFFFLDDDDSLPDDYLSVLRDCVAAGTPLAFTNEVVDGRLQQGHEYSEQAFIRNPMLVHHLVVCDTNAAKQAAKVIPRGPYLIEPLLYFQVAKGGASFIDRVGYYWNRSTGGNMHKAPCSLVGQVKSRTWCARNVSV